MWASLTSICCFWSCELLWLRVFCFCGKISDCRTSAISELFFETGPFFWHVPLLYVSVLVKPVALHLRSIYCLPRQPNTCGNFVPRGHRNNNLFKCCVQCVTSMEYFGKLIFLSSVFKEKRLNIGLCVLGFPLRVPAGECWACWIYIPSTRLPLSFTLYF